MDGGPESRCVGRVYGLDGAVRLLSRILKIVTLRMCSDILYQLGTTDAISWNPCYVYVCSYALNMFKTIDGTADCEIRYVIRFLKARNVLPSDIHQTDLSNVWWQCYEWWHS